MSRLLSVGAFVALLCTGVTGALAKTTSPVPTQGTLLVAAEEGAAPTKLPLVHTAVTAHVAGWVGQVKVRQTFNNPFKDPLEAVYVFPLPENAAVSDMTITVGARVIRGLIKKKAEARKMYDRAKAQGKTAALLDQERPNIFTQSVANIEPGKEVVVEISYDVQLKYEDGKYHFNYPMVVGPRYIPGTPNGKPTVGGGTSPDTDRVPDASRITPPMAKKGSRSGKNVTIDVTLEPGMAVREIMSPTHAITSKADPSVSPHALRIELSRKDEIPNKDFVLRYRVADDKPALSVLSHKDNRGGFFALRFEPPARPNAGDVTPKEIFFVVDTSGSMSGKPIELVKRAMRYAISNLNPGDTFQIIRFSNSASTLGASPLKNTPQNVAKALLYIDQMSAGGGTNMHLGVRAALDEKRSEGRLRIVSFMTDGYIGNDTEILAAIDQRLGKDTRLFSFGVGSSPNRYLLERMAQVGRGSVQYMLLKGKPEAQVARFYSRIKAPVLTHIEIDWAGLSVGQISPKRASDLFVGQPLALVGRYGSAGATTVKVKGRLGGRPIVYNVPVTLVDGNSGNAVLARLWARERIRELSFTQLRSRDKAAEAEITRLGLLYRLVTKYTSFIAVDDRQVVEGGQTRTVQVPVHKPAGTTFGGSPIGGSMAGDDDDDDDDYDVDEDSGGYAEAKSAPGAWTDIRAVRQRLSSGRPWRFGAGVGLGLTTGTLDDQSALVSSLHLRADRLVLRDLAVGAQLGLLIPAGKDRSVVANLLAEVAYLRLLRGALQFVFGTGPSFSSDGVGVGIMGALEVKTPAYFGIQLRYDGTIRPSKDDASNSNVTLGVEFTF